MTAPASHEKSLEPSTKNGGGFDADAGMFSVGRRQYGYMRIGFDFDGTLAVWPRGSTPRYDDPEWSLANAAAVLAAVKWLKLVLKLGHDVVIVTGRGEDHVDALRYWLLCFTGQRLRVIARPAAVSLSCDAQAAWKAGVLTELGVSAYVGDNHRIDAVAARIAGCGFIDAACFLRGEMPQLLQSHPVVGADA